MMVGVKFGNGVQLAIDLGDRVRAELIGTAIRFVGGKVAQQVRRSADLAAKVAVERVRKRKERKEK